MSRRKPKATTVAARRERAGKTPTRIREDGRKVADIPATRTHREKVTEFVEEYKKTGSITDACRLSGLSNGHAKDLIQCHPELREDISSLLARCGVTPEVVVTELRRIATYDPRQMLDESGETRPMQEWPEDLARAVSGMDVVTRRYEHENAPDTVETTHKPRFADKLGPLKELARMAGLAADRIEIANPRGEKFGIHNDAPAETKDQIIASLLAIVAPKKDPPAPERKPKK